MTEKERSAILMRANFRNHTNFIRELFEEYITSYPEVPIEEITAMMICETVNEINTSATIAYRYRNERE